MRGLRTVLFTGAAWLLPHTAIAADISAEQSALLYDLLNPAAQAQTAPAGTDPGVFQDALKVLKDKHLIGQSGRPNFSEPGLLDKYAKALFLGNRGQEFAADIAHIHDLVYRGQKDKLETALADLWVKAGRAKPDAKALAPVINSLYGEKGSQPSETVRHVFDGPESRVEVIHAKAGGRMQVDVETKNSDGSIKERTVFSGVAETSPTADGRDLERRLKPEKICTNTPESDKEAMEKLAGEWLDKGKGETWMIEVSGQNVTLTEQRKTDGPLVYSGEYRLGRIFAKHRISKVTDMGAELPLDVRQQIVGKNIDFRVSLEFCGNQPGQMRGTWSSQHVTYDGMTLTISKIHDPFDVSLILGRPGAGETKKAEGAAKGDTP